MDKRTIVRRGVKTKIVINNLPEEKWKNIIGFEGRYSVSNLGRVKVLGRYLTAKNGKVFYKHERIKIAPLNKTGYYRVQFMNDSGQAKSFSVHRLVCIHFVIKRDDKRNFVNHKDGDKKNNFYKNLEWCTRGENKKHSYDVLGEIPRRGQRNGNSKLTQTKVDAIRGMYKSGASSRVIAKEFSVAKAHIHRIVSNKSWRK